LSTAYPYPPYGDYSGDAMNHFPAFQKKTVQLSAILIVGISSLAHAETSVGPNEKNTSPPWELYDTDKDGYISAKEAEEQNMPPGFSRVWILTGMAD
jgi:Ca2+-binding EF-hand superfamily protein